MTDPITKQIHCCSCSIRVDARLTNGVEIYPHRTDLHGLPFWRCDACSNYVGCHHKTANRTNPLGNIPTPAIRKARKHIHAILDPIWKSGVISRNELYQRISDHMGFGYHTAQLRTIEECRQVYSFVKGIQP